MKKSISILIDVRTQAEFDAGHLPDALLIPYEEIASKIAEITSDKSAKIDLYCRTGRRSGIAEQILRQMGYLEVKNIGGYLELLGNYQTR